MDDKIQKNPAQQIFLSKRWAFEWIMSSKPVNRICNCQNFIFNLGRNYKILESRTVGNTSIFYQETGVLGLVIRIIQGLQKPQEILLEKKKKSQHIEVQTSGLDNLDTFREQELQYMKTSKKDLDQIKTIVQLN